VWILNFQENNREENPLVSFSRLDTIREELKLVKEKSDNLEKLHHNNLFEENESYFENEIRIPKPKEKLEEIDPERFTRKRSNSMFASFQNLVKKDEDNIRLLLPLEKDQDLNLPIADAVLELQLEYMEKFRKNDMKKFIRRKSCWWSLWGKIKKGYIGEFIILDQDLDNNKQRSIK